MSDRWRPNFSAEFKEEIEQFLERNENKVPFSDPRNFVEAVVKNKIMEIETRDTEVEEKIAEMIEEGL